MEPNTELAYQTVDGDPTVAEQPQPPQIIAPEDLSRVPLEGPPQIQWESSRSERFTIRFSTTDGLGQPRIDSGCEYRILASDCDSGGVCTWVPSDVWLKVLQLASNNGGTIYFAIFARDSLDRLTWSHVQELKTR